MAVTQTGSISLKVISDLVNTLDLTSVRANLRKNFNITFKNGTGANQANALFHDTRTIAASGNEDLDLAGALSNAFGQTLTFTKVKAVIIRAHEGNTNNVQVTRPADTGCPIFMAAGDGIAIPPGGMFAFVVPTAGGVTVTASSGDIINVANSSSGTGVTYDVIILGTV